MYSQHIPLNFTKDLSSLILLCFDWFQLTILQLSKTYCSSLPTAYLPDPYKTVLLVPLFLISFSELGCSVGKTVDNGRVSCETSQVRVSISASYFLSVAFILLQICPLSYCVKQSLYSSSVVSISIWIKRFRNKYQIRHQSILFYTMSPLLSFICPSSTLLKGTKQWQLLNLMFEAQLFHPPIHALLAPVW